MFFKIHRDIPWEDHANCASINESEKMDVLKKNRCETEACVFGLYAFVYFMISQQIFFLPSCYNSWRMNLIHTPEWAALNVTWFQPLDTVYWIKRGQLPGQPELELRHRLTLQELIDLGTEKKNVSVPIMAEMEATERGYAEETMRKRGPGTRSSGQLSKALHFLVKGRERCALITSQILRTWAKLGTEFSDLPLWTLFCYFL